MGSSQNTGRESTDLRDQSCGGFPTAKRGWCSKNGPVLQLVMSVNVELLGADLSVLVLVVLP